MTPEERRLSASAAAEASWAKTSDRSGRTAPARAAFMARFEKQVDPDGTLPPHERAVRAEHAMRAYMKGIARKRMTRQRKRREAAVKAATRKAGAA